MNFSVSLRSFPFLPEGSTNGGTVVAAPSLPPSAFPIDAAQNEQSAFESLRDDPLLSLWRSAKIPGHPAKTTHTFPLGRA